MADVVDADFDRAVIGYLLDPVDSEFFPRTPGKVLKYARGKQPPVDDSSEAWGEAAAWIRDSRNAVGILYTAGYTDRAPWAEGAPAREGQPVRDQVRDAAIRAGIRAMGGCSALLNLGDRDLSTDTEAGLRKAFRDAYTSSKTTGLRDASDRAITALTGGGARQIERQGPEPIGRSLPSTVLADRPAAR
jgi:hypothetical protein